MRTPQFLRFCAAGFAATATHVAVFVMLVEALAVPPWLAAVPAFMAAVTVSYRANRRWTFGATASGQTCFPRYLLVAAGGAGANAGMTFIVVNLLGWWYGAALAVALVAIPPATFLLAKTWVFAGKENRATTAAETEG